MIQMNVTGRDFTQMIDLTADEASHGYKNVGCRKHDMRREH